MSEFDSQNERILKSLIEGSNFDEIPVSRNGAILLSIINDTAYTAQPQSRIEELLLQLKEQIETSAVTEFVKILPFSEGTDAEIVAMVRAADQGHIKLSDYWSVGDEREITLSAMTADGVGEAHAEQKATLVLLQEGLYVDTNDKPVNFIVGLKDSLNEAGYMNPTATNAGSWEDSARRAWCNSTFYNAIPSDLLPAFKMFKTVTASAYNSVENIVSTDYFALAAEAEVFGVRTYSNQAEFDALTQFEYYKTQANRAKKRNGQISPSWERSPCYANTTMFCFADGYGLTYRDTASNSYGIAPFGCI